MTEIVDVDKVDLIQLKSSADDILWWTQAQDESVIKTLAQCREMYADAIIAYENGTAQQYARIMLAEKLQVTTAKEMARDLCSSEYRDMIKLEQRKKKLQDYAEALHERLNTIKIIMRVRHGDFQ